MPFHNIPQHLLRFADKWLSGTITEEERKEFDEWYNSFDDTQLDFYGDESETEMESRLQSLILYEVAKDTHKGVKYLWYKIAAAAVILIFLSSTLYLYFTENRKTAQKIAQQTHDPIVPGGNKAILTLANGKKISLTDASNGQIASQSGIHITKTKNGQLIYTITEQSTSALAAYNTIETPKGGQYQVILPDGTKVYLNAASSLTYPTSFAAARERAVSLTGEAYFEVAKDRNKPFRVFASSSSKSDVLRNQVVEVLGTHFNINAYADEPSIKTTLVEGAVNVNHKYRLMPDQQSVFDGKTMRIIPVDTEVETAWKNGDFVFKDQDLSTVLRTISRWYDVNFETRINIENLRFGGFVSRSKDISAVIKMMEATGDVKFKFEGRRIIMIK